MSESLNVDLERNCELAGKHRGERCFILACGPSIKKQNLHPLRDEVCISVSNFFVHPEYQWIKPAYHVVAGFCESHHTQEGWANWMLEMDARTCFTTMFFPLRDKERNLSASKFETHKLHFVDLEEGNRGFEKCDLTELIPSPWSVTVTALTIAIYMGFKEIYLLGCDHDWILHMHKSTHFYEEKQHALMRAGLNEWADDSMKRQCQHLIDLWTQYEALHQTAKRLGIEIFNATEGGILDVFQQVRLEATLAQINNQRLGVI